jgi:hypothetical protein
VLLQTSALRLQFQLACRRRVLYIRNLLFENVVFSLQLLQKRNRIVISVCNCPGWRRGYIKRADAAADDDAAAAAVAAADSKFLIKSCQSTNSEWHCLWS